jgi:hypothetical protein
VCNFESRIEIMFQDIRKVTYMRFVGCRAVFILVVYKITEKELNLFTLYATQSVLNVARISVCFLINLL